MKAPTPITEENIHVPSIYNEKWAPVDHYIADKYASINGAPIYMSITCRPDITYGIGKTSRGMHQPTPCPWGFFEIFDLLSPPVRKKRAKRSERSGTWGRLSSKTGTRHQWWTISAAKLGALFWLC